MFLHAHIVITGNIRKQFNLKKIHSVLEFYPNIFVFEVNTDFERLAGMLKKLISPLLVIYKELKNKIKKFNYSKK